MNLGEVFIHSCKDTIVLFPVLLLVYFLIEYLEYKNIVNLKKSSLFQGKCSPIYGSLFGVIPQCGFSVISAELYAEKSLSIGALVAVFIATSDEAIPLMLANPDSYLSLLILVVSKIIAGILFGYLAMGLYKLFFKGKNKFIENRENALVKSHEGCCKHDLENNKFNYLHPIFHALKITLFIFIVNFIMTLIIHLIGEENLSNFLEQSKLIQPLFACIIGLIPNCASSVILTELFILEKITFGAVFTGLCVNSGIAFIVLLKNNKSFKENLFVLLVTVIPSLVVGYLIHFFA